MIGSEECPKCLGDSRIADTRCSPDRPVLRRRICLDCGLRWSTLEVRYIRHKKAMKEATSVAPYV